MTSLIVTLKINTGLQWNVHLEMTTLHVSWFNFLTNTPTIYFHSNKQKRSFFLFLRSTLHSSFLFLEAYLVFYARILNMPTSSDGSNKLAKSTRIDQYDTIKNVKKEKENRGAWLGNRLMRKIALSNAKSQNFSGKWEWAKRVRPTSSMCWCLCSAKPFICGVHGQEIW